MADVPGRILDNGGACYNVRHPDFGAIGDGILRGPTGVPGVNDRAAIQAAIDAAHAAAAAPQSVPPKVAGRKVYIPAGKYMLDGPLILPRDGNRLTHFSIEGEFASSVYKGAASAGTILVLPANKNAIEIVGPCGETSEAWTEHIELSNLYVQGPHLPGYTPVETTGFNLCGVFFGRFHNLHAEGFGTGLKLTNGSEYWFSGLTLIANCSYGAILQRTQLQSDLQAWFENLVTLENRENLVLDQVRSVWIKRGENITKFHTDGPRRRLHIKNGGNTQVHIQDYVLEHHLHNTTVTEERATSTAGDLTADPRYLKAPIYIDASGVSELTLDRVNYETVEYKYPASVDPSNTDPNVSRYVPPMIECAGHFDAIAVRNCALPPVLRLELAVKRPLVEVTATGANTAPRANRVIVEGNSSAVAEAWIADSTGGDPLGGVVPQGWQQVCGRPELDEVNDNRITVPAGTQSWTASNVLAGRARLFWPGGTGAVQVHFPRVLRNLPLIYVSAVLDDNGGLVVPAINEILVPGGVVSRFSGGYATLACTTNEVYSVGQRTFRRYIWTIVFSSQTAFPNGMTGLVLSGIHGGGSGTGIEVLNVYVDTRRTGPVVIPPRRRATVPGAADGYPAVGDVVYNGAPLATGTDYAGWVCTVGGLPGAWRPFGLLA